MEDDLDRSGELRQTTIPTVADLGELGLMSKRTPSLTQQLSNDVSADIETLVGRMLSRSNLADAIAKHTGCDQHRARLVIAELTARGLIVDNIGYGHYELVRHRRRGRWIIGRHVPPELIDAAIAASPGLSLGYQYSDQDLRTDVRAAVAGVLACLHPRPRLMWFRR